MYGGVRCHGCLIVASKVDPSMEMSLGLVGIADMLPTLSKAQASILIPEKTPA
jgi:hypothetical protein